MKVALCCIGRLENRYAVEYVEYYKKLGFDKIFIYDNNYGDEEHFEEVLQSYIDNGLVEITDFRNKEYCQINAYTDCYNKHNNEYDWIAFFDFDEYLFINDKKNIKEFLSNKIYDDFECIHVHWMVYDDNDLLTYDSRPLIERFTRPIEPNTRFNQVFPENNFVKSIVRKGIENFKWTIAPHSPTMDLLCCNNEGIEESDDMCTDYNHTNCHLKHFTTKTIEEWVENKMIRGTADRPYNTFKTTYPIEKFFDYNRRTKEKIKILNKHIKDDNQKIMKVALCCIGRMENRYAVEYVEYYKKLGFDKIFIYDNNHDGEEDFEQIIRQPYMDDGFVETIDFRNKEVCQLEAYQDCYDKYNNQYDWICFFDFDEFLTLKKHKNIKEFLLDKRFDDFDIIHVNWMCYGDNGLIKYENKPVIERFKNPIIPLDFKATYGIPHNNHVKTIIRGGIDGVKWNGCTHTPTNKMKCCNADGVECSSISPFNNFSFKTAYIRHYITKSLEEYLTHKMVRRYCDREYDWFEKTNFNIIEEYFKINKDTTEKRKAIDIILNDNKNEHH